MRSGICNLSRIGTLVSKIMFSVRPILRCHRFFGYLAEVKDLPLLITGMPSFSKLIKLFRRSRRRKLAEIRDKLMTSPQTLAFPLVCVCYLLFHYFKFGD